MKELNHFNDWYLAIQEVMDKHDIKDADLLDKLLSSRHPWRVPTKNKCKIEDQIGGINMETQCRRMDQRGTHPVSWWLDVKAVMYDHGISDAQELAYRLSGQSLSASSACAKRVAAAGFIKEPISQPDPPKLPRPTIGRIVHYISKDGNELPAIIVAISSFTPDQWVYLKAIVWGDRREDVSDFAIYSEEKKVRTWHWPERG